MAAAKGEANNFICELLFWTRKQYQVHKNQKNTAVQQNGSSSDRL
jgi:hypothetical protein